VNVNLGLGYFLNEAMREPIAIDGIRNEINEIAFPDLPVKDEGPPVPAKSPPLIRAIGHGLLADSIHDAMRPSLAPRSAGAPGQDQR